MHEIYAKFIDSESVLEKKHNNYMLFFRPKHNTIGKFVEYYNLISLELNLYW